MALGSSGRNGDAMWIIITALCVMVVVTISIGIWYAHIIAEVKQEVSTAPRIPMFTCDKHGIFPAKNGTVTISVPQEGAPDLLQELCIFCYDEKMKAVEKIFKV
jgi:hypothetical protein